jgi:protocatechuate 3,4-dioxygenase, beta subunit
MICKADGTNEFLGYKIICMKQFLLLAICLAVSTLHSCAQSNHSKSTDKKVGGGCEGCEAIYESPVPFEKLEPMVWLPDWNEKGQKLAVNGTVYKADGKTPAEGVIIYIYHTDQAGIYPKKGNEEGWAKRHGYLRGWMKTDKNGFYKFFTLRPASYPNSKNPAHIHITIKEPGKQEYWIDDFLFDDDPLLTEDQRKHIQNRGGSGILQTKPAENILKAERNIYLGKNIPNYAASASLQSQMDCGYLFSFIATVK